MIMIILTKIGLVDEFENDNIVKKSVCNRGHVDDEVVL
jgi:hypothetical protein